jgi:hypothetical protein
MANHNKNLQYPEEMLDIDNSENLTAADQSYNRLKTTGFWVSVGTSALALCLIFRAVSLEMLTPIIPNIQTFIDSNWFSWGIHIAACAYLAYKLASLLDFYLIDIHGRAGITEYIIFFEIWSSRRNNPNLGKYRSGITFPRVFNATANLVLLFIGYFLSFMTSLLGSAEVGKMLLPSNASDSTAKINSIISRKNSSRNSALAEYNGALDAITAEKFATIKEQSKPYFKAAQKLNKVALFKIDSIRKDVEAQYAERQSKAQKAYNETESSWQTTLGISFDKEIKEVEKRDKGKENMSNLVSNGATYSGTFAVSFSVLIIILQCFNDVGKKPFVKSQSSSRDIVEGSRKGEQGKSNSNNHSPN